MTSDPPPDGVTWTQATGSAAFPARASAAAAVFNGRMWVIGGYDSNSRMNDVWSSADGINWTQATASAPFSARSDLQALVLNSQLCVIAGNDGTRTHDAWCSSDGTQWRVATQVVARF